MEKDYFKLIDGLFENYEKIVEYAINSKDLDPSPERIFLDTYTRFREKVKNKKGSGSGFTGIPELLYFQYIKRFLEKELGVEFQREPHSLKDSKEQVNLFKAPYNGFELILISDVLISEDKHVDLPLFNFEKNEKMYIKPDIFVGVKNKTTTIPIAFFELKIWIEPGKIKTQVNDRFKNLKKNFASNEPYYVFIFLASKDTKKYNENLEEFLSISDKCLLMRFLFNDFDNENFTYIGEFKNDSIEKIATLIKKEIKKLI